MRLPKIYYKLFGGGKWMVGWREKQDQGGVYKIAEVPKGQWVADPFLYEADGKHYIFVEQYDVKAQRAGIGFFEFVDGKPVNRGMVISQPYHMSYPCVFSYKGQHYMIPETSGNKTIELYRAVDFPYKWTVDTVLSKGKKYVDSTVMKNGEEFLLFSYSKEEKEWVLSVFLLDMESRMLTARTTVSYPVNIGRPAGAVFERGGHYRPSQDCRSKYGEAVLINRIDKLNECVFKEHMVGTIESSDIRLPVKQQRVHTINYDSKYEVIDAFQERFDLFHAIRIFIRSHKAK